MLSADSENQRLTNFVSQAERYLETVVRTPPREDFVRDLLPEMVFLYYRALALPTGNPQAVEPKTGRPPIEDWRLLHGQLTELLADWNVYRTAVVDGSDSAIEEHELADDLSDVSLDLRAGLAALQVSADEAAWVLRFTFETHWGYHLVDAIRALHYRLV